MTIRPTTPVPEQIAGELTDYVRERFLQGDDDVALTVESPLLEWGVLSSLNTAVLLTHIRDAYGVDVPPTAITATHLRNTRSIAALVAGLADAGR